MLLMNYPPLTTRDILSARGKKNSVDAQRPYSFFVEPEISARGTVEDVAIVLLSNRECPFHCLMCDLWKNTLDERVPVGSISAQLDYAFGHLPPVRHVKLYNSGNFFDAQAIPPEEFPDIAARVRGMKTVVVENHPRLCGDSCLRFRDLLPADCQLELAIGLETIHPEVLPRLNKQMSVDDFERAVTFLTARGITTRAFILLRPPFLDESEGVDWALRSIEFAFSVGVGCCCVIPTRDGNGIMEQLRREGHFRAPQLRSLESVVETALRLQRGRVLADLWDLERIEACPICGDARRSRLKAMNLTQQIPPPISCTCQGAA